MVLRPGSQTVFEIRNFRPNPRICIQIRTTNRVFLLDIAAIFTFLATDDVFFDPQSVGLPQGVFLNVLVTLFPAIPDTVFPTIMTVDTPKCVYFDYFSAECREYAVRNSRGFEIRDRKLINETRVPVCVKKLNHWGPQYVRKLRSKEA